MISMLSCISPLEKPAVGDSVRLWDYDEARWVFGRIDHFDDSGAWAFVATGGHGFSEESVANLSFITAGAWEQAEL